MNYTVTITGGASGVKDLAGHALESNYSWSFTAASGGGGADTYTVFQVTNSPQEPANNDGQGIVLGMKFRSSQNGFITGVRYYKGAGTTGTHTGHLWSSTGTHLGSTTFTGETASGWQQTLFSSPIAINANISYVVSLFSPSGDYASSDPYFTQTEVNGPLRALANGEDGPNGLYRYSSISVFPDNSFNASNYWVDVVFTTSGGGGTAPNVSAHPASQAVCTGSSVNFTSDAGGTPAPTVQWQQSTNGITWTNISGATNGTLTFTATTLDNNKQYRSVWTNSTSSVNSGSATLTVSTIPSAPVVSVVNNCGSSELSVGSTTGSLLWSNGATTPSVTVTTPGTFTVTKSVNGCTGPAGSGSASPKTTAILTSSLKVSVESGEPLNYVPTSSEPGTVLTWNRAAVNGISNPAATGSGNINETLINTKNSPVKVIYEYTLELNGCATKLDVVVTVNPLRGEVPCVNTTTIEHNFNSQKIEAGRYIWFVSTLENLGNSNAKKQEPVTILVTNSVITFWENGTKYSLTVPDSRIQFTNDVISATTAFVNNVWETKVPLGFKDEVFMGGLSYQVPVTLAGNIKKIQWTADVSIDQPNVPIKWEWGAAKYSKFASHDGLNIKPVSGPKFNQYQNSDEAGTPENYKPYLLPGGTGKKHWKEYTGNHSGKKTIVCHGKKEDKWPPFKSIPHKNSIQKLDVSVNPNPSNNSFGLKFETKSNAPISVTITDQFGQVVEKYERINSLGVLRFGDNLKTGIYFVDIRQGDQRKTITVLKIR